MADTYTSRNGFQKMEVGQYVDSWGTQRNANIDIYDECIDGFESVTNSGGVTLSTTNGTTNQARQRTINLSGTGGTVVAPGVEKFQIFRNACSGLSTISNGTNSVVIPKGNAGSAPRPTIPVIQDGTNIHKVGASNPWLLVQSNGLTNVSSFTTTFDPDAWIEHMLVFKGVTHDGAGNADLKLTIDGGSTYAVLGNYANTATLYGSIIFHGLSDGLATLDAGHISVGLDDFSTTGISAADVGLNLAWRHSTISAATITFNGETFDGTIEEWVRT